MKGRGSERGNRLPTGLEAEQESFEGLTGNYPLYDSSSPLFHEIHSHPSRYQFAIFIWMTDSSNSPSMKQGSWFSPQTCSSSSVCHFSITIYLVAQTSTPWKFSSSFCSHIHIQPPSKSLCCMYIENIPEHSYFSAGLSKPLCSPTWDNTNISCLFSLYPLLHCLSLFCKQ